MLNTLTLKEVADMLKASTSWVRLHFVQLGGFKIGSKIFFTEEGISNAIQRLQELESNRYSQRRTMDVYARHKTRSKRVGNKEKETTESNRENEIRDELLKSL